MSDLTEFLLARIAEDEAAATESQSGGWSDGSQRLVAQGKESDGWEPVAPGWVLAEPAYVLAEARAKRRIVELSAQQIAAADERHPEQIERSFNAGAAFVAHNTLLALAAVYADHPDYGEAWRP